jgi:hypothetical protein
VLRVQGNGSDMDRDNTTCGGAEVVCAWQWV